MNERNKYVHLQENGDIILRPYMLVGKTGPSGLPLSLVTLSRMGCIFHWFKKILENTENNPEKCENNERKYHFSRNYNNLFIYENRANKINTVGFASDEIQDVLNEFNKVIEDLNSLYS